MAEHNSLLTLEEVLEATGGIHILGAADFFFSSVATDSRTVTHGSLFVPLIGEQQDGHTYIPQALERGAKVVFVCIGNYERDATFFTKLSLSHPDVIFIAVENTLTALQKSAGRYVEKFPRLIRIGITGSSGKTTTKEIAKNLLSQKYNVISTEGNLNSETGLPLSVFGIRAEHEVGIFELGMNRVHEMEELAGVLKPRFALVTNIGTAHIGNMGSRENIAKEKAHIFDHFHNFGTAFIPRNDDFAPFLADAVEGNVIFYGEGCDDEVKNIRDEGLSGTVFSVQGREVLFPLPGSYNANNAFGAIALARFLGVSAEQIAAGLSAVQPVFGRAQILNGHYTIIQDCYNANPASMHSALDLLKGLATTQKKIAVLGDMLELGDSSLEEHKRIGAFAGANEDIVFLFVGQEMRAAAEEARRTGSGNHFFYFKGCGDDTMKEVSRTVKEIAKENDIILLKGSRKMALERLSALVENR